MSVIDMRALRAVLAALLLLCALYVHFNSEIVDEWASGQRSNEDDNGLSLLGVQSCLLYTSPSPRDATL